MQSCIYVGSVAHARHAPIKHRFRYRLYMAYVDLEEYRTDPQLRSLIPSRRFALASFCSQDHLQRGTASVEESVRELVEERTGRRPSGPIGLLTQLRYFGYHFSPLNLYFCFDSQRTAVQAIVAEVNNTPWREQHHYVLSDDNRVGNENSHRYVHMKDFHVSPFMGMDFQYVWNVSPPGTKLRVQLKNLRGECRMFDALLSLKRRSLTHWSLWRVLVRYPVMSARIMAAIYWQALKIWWKKCPVYSHPKTKQSIA